MIVSYNHGSLRIWKNQKHLPEGETKGQVIRNQAAITISTSMWGGMKKSREEKETKWFTCIFREVSLYNHRLILLLIICQSLQSHRRPSFVIPVTTHYKEMMSALSDESLWGTWVIANTQWTVLPLRIVSNTGQFWNDLNEIFIWISAGKGPGRKLYNENRIEQFRYIYRKLATWGISFAIK